MPEIPGLPAFPPVSRQPLSGGCVSQVSLLQFEKGRRVVEKRRGDPAAPCLLTEGWMLTLLGEKGGLPVPQVLHATPDLLLLEFVEGMPGLTAVAQEDAAEKIAALHAVEGEAYGLERTTPIGLLPQDNRWCDSWLSFFRDRRLLPMARLAHARGGLGLQTLQRLDRLADQLDRWLEEPQAPALLHGDLWGGNIISGSTGVAAFIDPAVYFGHPEIELAFGTLFGTLNEWFFARYAEMRPLEPGFFEVRRDLYNLYPLLVHAAMFGGGYGQQVDRTLNRFCGWA